MFSGCTMQLYVLLKVPWLYAIAATESLSIKRIKVGLENRDTCRTKLVINVNSVQDTKYKKVETMNSTRSLLVQM
jgi:hypothetical protein